MAVDESFLEAIPCLETSVFETEIRAFFFEPWNLELPWMVDVGCFLPSLRPKSTVRFT